MMTNDLFTVAGEPPVLDPAPDFLRCFMAELRNGPTTASRVRQKHGIPGSPYIGIIVNALYCAGVIECVDYASAVTPESQRHLERVWKLVKPLSVGSE
jgi:hypothetical protein